MGRRWVVGGIAGILTAAVLTGCTMKEVMQESAPAPTEETAQVEAAPAPGVAAPEPAPAPQPEAPPPAPEPAPAAAAPAPASASVLKGPLAEKFKDVDPSLLIYLSGRGV
ncbi:MAG: hypothetical protein HY760_01080, partial [Nitrospirae bacterium]|nr:hypothetical protein [Nitrospirota bacterium]